MQSLEKCEQHGSCGCDDSKLSLELFDHAWIWPWKIRPVRAAVSPEVQFLAWMVRGCLDSRCRPLRSADKAEAAVQL